MTTAPTKTKKVFLSGPMTGLPESNYPAFHAAATEWRAEGCLVVNPAEFYGGKRDRTRAEYIAASVRALTDGTCTHIAMLGNWQSSPGACVERQLALEVELKVIEGAFSSEQQELPDEDPPTVEAVHSWRRAAFYWMDAHNQRGAYLEMQLERTQLLLSERTEDVRRLTESVKSAGAKLETSRDFRRRVEAAAELEW